MVITRQGQKEASTAVSAQGDGASASAGTSGKRRRKPRKNTVNPVPPDNVVDAIEAAQPVASTSQLPVAEVPSETNKRPRKTKDPIVTNLWTQQPLALTSVLPVSKGSVKGKERMRQEDVDDMMRSTADNEVMEVANIEHYLPASATVLTDNGIISLAKGKKHAREEKNSAEATPSKRLKIARTSAETVITVAVKKAKAPAGKNGKRSTLVQSLKWKVVEPAQSDLPTSVESSPIKQTNLRPRIWTNSREELLAMMPEMAGSKCFNGISWALYETPMLLLDEVNTCFQVERDDKNHWSLDLLTTRSFACPIPYEFDIQKSSVIDIPPPSQPFEGPVTSAEPLSRVKARPRYRLKYKLPTIKNEISTQAIATSTSEAQGVETVMLPEELPTLAFRIQKPVLAGSLPESSSLDNDFEVASVPSYAKLEMSPTSHTLKFDPMLNTPGSPSTHPGVDFTKFIDMAFNIASDTAYQIQHSPSPSHGGDSSRPEAYNTPTPMTQEREVFMRDYLVQARRLPPGRQPFQSIPIIPSPIKGEPYTLGNIYSEDEQLSSLFSEDEDERNSPPPENPILISAAEACSHSRSMEPGGTGASSQPFSVMIEDSDDMQLVDPADSLIIKTEARYPRLGFPPQYERPISTSAAEVLDDTDTADIGSASQHISAKMDEDLDAMRLVDPKELLTFPVLKTDDGLHDYVPSPIPEELDAFTDSYLFGRPVTILISNGLLEKHWSLKLPNEYGYAMLGYFKILGVQETRVHVEDETNKSTMKAQALDSLVGQVRWKFHLQWAPGGEEGVLAEGNTFDLKRPWWDPSPSAEETSKEQATGPLDDKVQDEMDDPESSYPTTPRYRDARLRHHEYKFRHFPLDDLYQSLMPLHLLIPFGQDYMDNSFPRGWFCKDCGRMNFQAALRHRKCLSSLCKDKPPPVDAYAQILFLLRDPQERLPLSAPLNQFPEKLTTTSISRFPDGMQTFSYHLSHAPNIVMKHIFTSNAPPLQEPGTCLLRDIQINVPIVRPLTENTPYFFWSAKSPKENTAPTDTEWENILPTMNQAKNLIVQTVRSFGGLKEYQVGVNHLRMLAWITAGSKRGPDIIRAKNKSVIFFALGCTVVLVVTPQSMRATTTVNKSHEAKSSKLPKNDITDQDDATSGWIAENDEDGGVAEELIEIPKKITKSTKPSFVITLMHGDMIAFYGDEFEYSVKRDGTSLLLIASHDSFEHA